MALPLVTGNTPAGPGGVLDEGRPAGADEADVGEVERVDPRLREAAQRAGGTLRPIELQLAGAEIDFASLELLVRPLATRWIARYRRQPRCCGIRQSDGESGARPAIDCQGAAHLDDE